MKKMFAVLTPSGDNLAEPDKLQAFVQQIQQHNSKQAKQDIRNLHKYVNYIVVSSHPDGIVPIQDSGLFPQMQGRVVFDRHAKSDEGQQILHHLRLQHSLTRSSLCSCRTFLAWIRT